MDIDLDLPDPDHPVWTHAGGFVVRANEGIIKLTGAETMRVKATGEQTGGALALMEATVEANFGNVPHLHAEEEEAFYVLAGRFRFVNGDSTFLADPGDFVFVPRGVRHAFQNVRDEPSRMLVLYSPAGPEQFFLRYGDDPDPSGVRPAAWSDAKFARLLPRIREHNMVLLPRADDWQ